MKLISKKAVLLEIHEAFGDSEDNGLMYVIKNLPTFESRPKGKWIDGGRYSNHICSICKEEAECLQAGGGVEFLSDFCPYCGADMRTEDMRGEE